MLKRNGQPWDWARWWRGDFAGAPRWLLTTAILALAGSLSFALLSPSSSLRMNGPSPGASQPASSIRTELTQPEATGPPTVFIGDSYAAGAGASSPSRRWTSLVSKAEGWQEHNFAFGGTGYVVTSDKAGCGKSFCPAFLEAFDEALAATPHPGFIVISGGRNDLGSVGINTAVKKLFDQVCLKKAGAQVIVVAPFWQSSQRPASLNVLAREVQKQSSRCGIRFVDLGSPLDGTGNTVSKDGVHPNDGGHEAIAQAFEKAIEVA